MADAITVLNKGLQRGQIWTPIQRAEDVIRIAREEGLELAVGCAMLIKESGGGRNVWGSDGVDPLGTYVKGSEVTEQAYKAYRAKGAGAQGCGPTQLTYKGFQDMADKIGGCWDPLANIRIGFRILAGYQKTNGGNVKDTGARYNGGKPYDDPRTVAAARKYGDELASFTAIFRTLLGAVTPGPPNPTPVATGLPNLAEGDSGSAVAHLQQFLNATFPSYSKIDLGPQRYGPQTVAVVKEFQRRANITGPAADGTHVGPVTNAALAGFGYK